MCRILATWRVDNRLYHLKYSMGWVEGSSTLHTILGLQMTGLDWLTDETPITQKAEVKGDRHSWHHHDDNASAHPHIHSEESLRRIVNQLSRIEGHVRGIKVMLQESRPCPEVLIQLAAVRGAVDRVSRIILDEHLTECIARAATDGNIEGEIEQLKAALDRFLPLAKPKGKAKRSHPTPSNEQL